MKNINLFDYKQELKRVATQKRVVWAVEIVMLAVFLIIVYCGFQQVEIAYSETELEKLETRVKSLAAETTKIQSMKMQAKRVTEITEKIRGLRAKQFQVTQVLEGLTLSIPDEVWLTSVRQLTLKDVVSMKGPIIFFGDLQQRMPKKGKRGKKKEKGRPVRIFRGSGTCLGGTRQSDHNRLRGRSAKGFPLQGGIFAPNPAPAGRG